MIVAYCTNTNWFESISIQYNRRYSFLCITPCVSQAQIWQWHSDYKAHIKLFSQWIWWIDANCVIYEMCHKNKVIWSAVNINKQSPLQLPEVILSSPWVASPGPFSAATTSHEKFIEQGQLANHASSLAYKTRYYNWFVNIYVIWFIFIPIPYTLFVKSKYKNIG